MKDIGALRRPGLTPETLAGHLLLVRSLDTVDPVEGAKRLSELVHHLEKTSGPATQSEMRALRVALAIGFDRLKNVTARRKAALSSGIIFATERTVYNTENRAIKKLADFIVDKMPPEIEQEILHDPSKVLPTNERTPKLSDGIRPWFRWISRVNYDELSPKRQRRLSEAMMIGLFAMGILLALAIVLYLYKAHIIG
jgi:hypothetical protein